MAFNTVTLKASGLPDITFDGTDDGGVTLRAANYRFLTIRPAGGHWEISGLGSLPATGTGLEIDGGRAVIHEV